ncbi:MAG: hypothetical protein J0I06_08515 [Planctomycetes bacterium]|nr:hypothetical protein [Planctomycetota bacterium]
MRRILLPAIVAAVAVGASVEPALALRIAAPPSPGQMAATAQVVVIGKVTAIEKDLVEVPAPYAGAKDKQNYKIAVVKVETGLAGADKLKEIKVGVYQPPKPVPGRPVLGRPGGPAAAIELKEGQQLLLFLTKHPSADFYLMPGFNAPVDVTTDAGKKAVEEVKRVAAVLADPMKGLKSDKAEARAEAAVVMVTKYRAYPTFGGETEQVAVGAEESKLILKGLAEGEWKAGRFGGPPNAFMAFNSLGLTEKDGWISPVIVNPPPGQPAPDYAAVHKDAFTKWLAGPGKDYQVKKVVPKAKAEK